MRKSIVYCSSFFHIEDATVGVWPQRLDNGVVMFLCFWGFRLDLRIEQALKIFV